MDANLSEKEDTRKQPPSIVNEIFRVLEEDGTKSTNEIAISIGSNTQTVKRWVETIKLIQSKAKLIVEKTARITLVRIEKKD